MYQLLEKLYDRIVEVDIATRACRAFAPDGRELDALGKYDDWIAALARAVPPEEGAALRAAADFGTALAEVERGGYCVFYQGEGGARRQMEYLRAADGERLAILMRAQGRPSLQDRLRRGEERFRYITGRLCELFLEIDARTGESVLYRGEREPERRGAYDRQLEWLARYRIAPQEREAFLREFGLENLLWALRRQDGYFSTTYLTADPGGARSLLFACALRRDPCERGREIVYCFTQDVTPLREKEERNRMLVDISQQLLTLSQTEPVTCLLNRAEGEKRITEYLSFGGPGNTGTMLLLDIDHFKGFNDQYGHQTGDQVLRYLAASMRQAFRSDDALVRWGGDEFLVFLYGVTSPRVVSSRVERLREQMRAFAVKGAPFPVTLSIGGKSTAGSVPFRALFRQCDENLYRVKAQGRDGVEINFAIGH